MNTATTQQLTVAAPALIVEAWEVGVMYGNRSYAELEASRHPFEGQDAPTYHRDDVGWHDAATIGSQSAQGHLADYLAARGFRVPDRVQEAWDETNRLNDLRQQVLNTVRNALFEVDEEPPADLTLAAYVNHTLCRLQELLDG